MKQIKIILGLILIASVSTFAQSPRIKLNQITKDTVKGSVLISSPSDSGMVYSRDLFISYGADTFLILGGDTLAATSSIISSVLSDGVTITGDGTSGNELTVDTATVIATKQDLDLYYLDSNPDGYTSNTGTVTSVGGTGTVNGISLSGTVTSSGNLTLGGTLSGVDLTSQVTDTLPIANGGTGSGTQNFVDLSTTQSISGNKTFSSNETKITNTSSAALLKIDAPAGYTSSFQMYLSGTSYGIFGIANNSDDFIVSSTNGDFCLRARPNEKILFSSDGGTSSTLTLYQNEVGIGTTSPSEVLEVNGNILASGTITPNGSDRKLKTNISTLNSGLDVISNLIPVTYDFIQNTDKKFPIYNQVGFVAQDVQDALSGKSYINGIVIETKDYLALDYDKFTPIIVKAIQEQQSIIESQATEIKTLKSQIQLILNEIEQIKNN